MSLGEVLVVMFVAIIVTKPGDITVIIKKLQQLKSYFTDIKHQVISYITQDMRIDDSILDNTPEQLNFYLERIINLQGYYEGDYSLKHLKAKHNELIKLNSVNLIKTDKPYPL